MTQSFDAFQLALAALATGIASAAITALIARARLATQSNAHTAALQELQSQHLLALAMQREASLKQAAEVLLEGEARFEKRLQDQSQSALSVTVHPFVNTEAEKSMFSRQTKVEIGYKYQLFVQGLPCFEPHSVVVESTIQKEVNEEAIAFFQSRALQAAETAVQIKSGGVASKVISVARAVIKYAK